jgi:hypothetical protein
VLAGGGTATVGVALAPLPAAGGAVTHTAAAAVAFTALAAWPALAGRRTRTWPFGRAVAGITAGVLGAEVAALLVVLLTEGPHPGLVERVAAGSQALTPLIAVAISRRNSASRTTC